MEIRQFRVVLKARDFDRTCSFYGETLALPRLQSWGTRLLSGPRAGRVNGWSLATRVSRDARRGRKVRAPKGDGAG